MRTLPILLAILSLAAANDSARRNDEKTYECSKVTLNSEDGSQWVAWHGREG